VTVDPRIQETAHGALLFDAARHARADEQWFDGAHWAAAGAIVQETSGRGSVLIVQHSAGTWVLRHYHRGGVVARLISDHYLWLGLERTRAFREWRLLAHLHAAGLPVPDPVAARVVRTGVIYTADIITAYLPDTRKLSSYIAEGRPPAACWPRIGAMLRAFHDHGVDHPDLTAHNILLDPQDGVFLVDFDNACRRPPGEWEKAGLQRFKRSLRKVALETGTQFDESAWRSVESAYERASGAAGARAGRI
jgi:3-deoxy-D-manno-octulosonic acid kinase